MGLKPLRLSGERSGRGRACFLELPLSGKSLYSMALDGSKWQRRLETPENFRECSQAWRSYLLAGQYHQDEKSNCMKWKSRRKHMKTQWERLMKEEKVRPCHDSAKLFCVCCLEVKPVASRSIHVSGDVQETIQAPQEPSLWLQRKDSSPETLCFLFRLRTSVISARASIRCKYHTHWPFWVLRSRSSTNGTCLQSRILTVLVASRKLLGSLCLEIDLRWRSMNQNGVELLVRPTLIPLKY